MRFRSITFFIVFFILIQGCSYQNKLAKSGSEKAAESESPAQTEAVVNQPQAWSAKEKTAYIQECKDLFSEKPGFDANEVCGCFQEETEKQYSFAESEDLDGNQKLKSGKNCLSQFEGKTWPEGFRQIFLSRCMERLKGNSEVDRTVFCPCFFGKVESKYDFLQFLDVMGEREDDQSPELEAISKECL
jgi:hypothetical protein